MNYSSRAFIFVLIFSFVNSQFDVNCSQPEKNYTITYNDLDHYYGDVGIGCNGYSNNVLYNWTMTLPKEFNIILMWSFINTQLDHDYVTVYNSNGEQISHISGSPIGINQSTLMPMETKLLLYFLPIHREHLKDQCFINQRNSSTFKNTLCFPNSINNPITNPKFRKFPLLFLLQHASTV